LTDDSFFDGDAGASLVETMSEERRSRAEFMSALRQRHFRTQREKEVEEAVKRLMERTAAARTGGEGTALFVVGETGAGKTRAVARAVDRLEEARSVETFTGRTLPIARVVAPSPCTMKMLGVEILHALGYPLAREVKESTVWGIVRQQLRARAVRAIHIDEGQHMLNWRDRNERQKLADTLKNVLQQPDWPVSFIVSGLPELAEFLASDRQLHRRSEVLHLGSLEMPKHAKLLEWMTQTVITEHAGMEICFPLSEDFIGRLHRAATGQFGIAVQLVHHAVEQVLTENADGAQVEMKHFRKAYARFSGCQASDNIFESSKWHLLQPRNAMSHMVEESKSNTQSDGGGRNKSNQ
jgi:hypothetical protein